MEAIELAKLGRGLLCSLPLILHDANVARKVIIGVAPYHGLVGARS
jgi:hypothetical protein